jgi:hypothetical protein
MAEELVDGFSKYPMSGYIANIFKKEVKWRIIQKSWLDFYW